MSVTIMSVTFYAIYIGFSQRKNGWFDGVIKLDLDTYNYYNSSDIIENGFLQVLKSNFYPGPVVHFPRTQ